MTTLTTAMNKALVEKDRVAKQAEADLVDYIMAHREMYEIQSGVVDYTDEQYDESWYFIYRTMEKKKQEIEPFLTGPDIDECDKFDTTTPKADLIEGRIWYQIEEEAKKRIATRTTKQHFS